MPIYPYTSITIHPIPCSTCCIPSASCRQNPPSFSQSRTVSADALCLDPFIGFPGTKADASPRIRLKTFDVLQDSARFLQIDSNCNIWSHATDFVVCHHAPLYSRALHGITMHYQAEKLIPESLMIAPALVRHSAARNSDPRGWLRQVRSIKKLANITSFCSILSCECLSLVLCIQVTATKWLHHWIRTIFYSVQMLPKISTAVNARQQGETPHDETLNTSNIMIYLHIPTWSYLIQLDPTWCYLGPHSMPSNPTSIAFRPTMVAPSRTRKTQGDMCSTTPPVVSQERSSLSTKMARKLQAKK